jgi:hypothetical protein
MPTVVLDPPPVELEQLIERRRRLGQDLFDEVWDGVLHMNPAPHGRHAKLAQQLAVPLAGPLRLLALARSLAVNPVQARQALRVLPELLLGTAAWALGCLSSSDH